MALFPSVIPWTLVLTQVMTAGLAVVPGRWGHLFRKCLQVQVLCGWERARGGTQRCRLPLPVGSGSLKRRRRKKKKISLHSSKSGGGERSRWWGLSAPSSDVLSLTYSAKICMGGWSRSFQSWWCQTANSKGYHTDGIEQTPCLTKKEKTHNTAWLHGLVENAFNAATVLLVFVFFHIWQLWTLRVIAQTWPFSRRGKWYLYVKIPELV